MAVLSSSAAIEAISLAILSLSSLSIASSEDDGEDFENTFDYLISYASNSDMFELYHNDYVSDGLYPMFHMISSENLIEHGICQQDVYVPVRLKNNE